MPPVPLRIRSVLRGAPRPSEPPPPKKQKKPAEGEERKEGEDEIRERIAQSWIVYHLAAALAERNRRHNDRFATETMRKISLDLHHFVLTACKACSDHHLAYLAAHPVDDAVALEGGFEEWVFDLHNAVNQRAGKPVLAKVEHLPAVVAHYREALDCLGRGATTTLLSRALPVLTSRFCYGCQ